MQENEISFGSLKLGCMLMMFVGTTRIIIFPRENYDAFSKAYENPCNQNVWGSMGHYFKFFLNQKDSHKIGYLGHIHIDMHLMNNFVFTKEQGNLYITTEPVPKVFWLR